MRVDLIGHYGSDDLVCDAARVSFDKRAANYTPEQNARLIAFLAREGHNSPFFHPVATFRITACIPVARQMMRHTVGLAVSEVSRRYVKSEPEFCRPVWREAAANVKQGSGGPMNDIDALQAGAIYADIMETTQLAYDALLELGASPEQARMVLPQAMETTWMWTGSLFAFARVCRERLAPDSQQETREVAGLIAAAMAELYPISWKALVP